MQLGIKCQDEIQYISNAILQWKKTDNSVHQEDQYVELNCAVNDSEREPKLAAYQLTSDTKAFPPVYAPTFYSGS